MRPLFACLAFLPLIACGPILSTSALVDAEVEVEAARAAGAERSATYEFTAAEAYLHEAREVAGYAAYAEATDFANRARDLARAARAKAQPQAARSPEAK